MKDKNAEYVPFPNFETPEQCEVRRRERIAGLKKAGEKFQFIVEELKLHDEGVPCQHPACPICMRGWRSTFVQNGARLIREKWEGEPGEIAFLVYVPPRSRISKGQLHRFDFRNFKDRIAKHFARSTWTDVSLLGGIDISWNECSNKSHEGYWSPHLQAVGRFPNGVAKARGQLAAYIGNKRASGEKLVFLEAVKNGATDVESVLGYCFKPYFDRRVAYKEDDGTQNVRKLPLKPSRELETIRLLDRYSRHSRIFTMGLVRRGLTFKSVGNSKFKKSHFDR